LVHTEKEIKVMTHPKTAEKMMNGAGPIERALLPRLVHITEAAAIAAAYQMGRGDKMFADHVAVEV
jgi:fructose-1,6-bisphosphatase II